MPSSNYTVSSLLARGATLGALLVLASACATTGSTLGSGVGDRVLERPPYYAGARVGQPAGRIGHLPVAYQRGGSHPPFFDPADESDAPVAALLAEMNAHLDALGATTRLAAAAPPTGTPPDVHFGCETDASGDCWARGETEAGKARMRLAVGRPSGRWAAWLGEALGAAGLEATLVLTLEVGQYWPRQRNLRGDKEVQLGTNHVVSLPWLTSLEAPVSVLQLTGALLGRDGRALRIGAEGLLARRTHLLLSSVGVQALISDEDVQRLRTSRRDDLPGQPRVWEVALQNLVAQLTGEPGLAIR